MNKCFIDIRIEPDWNVKKVIIFFNCVVSFIRIEPDWNVKAIADNATTFPPVIRIEPDWNVKLKGCRFFKDIFALE